MDLDQEDTYIPDKIPRGKFFNEEEKMDDMGEIEEILKEWPEFRDNQNWNENLNVAKPSIVETGKNYDLSENKNSTDLIWSYIGEQEWVQDIQTELLNENPKCCSNDQTELSSDDIELWLDEALGNNGKLLRKKKHSGKKK